VTSLQRLSHFLFVHRKLTVARSAALLSGTLSVVAAIAFSTAFISHAQNRAQQPAESLPTSVKQADAACGQCHEAIYNSYLRTPKANASGIATANLVPGSYTQPSSGATYRVETSEGKAWLRYASLGNASIQGEHSLDYFLGSGHLGITYLYSLDGYLMESPAAWYRVADGYDMKPGLEQLKEVAPAIPVEAACLRCHMSGVQAADTGTLNHYSGLPFQHGGITCESCHGDTVAHLKSRGKIEVVNPAKLAPDLRDSICINCHLEGDFTIEKNERSALRFKPGENIASYLSFFVYGNANPDARGVSEVEQFSASHCKRASGEKMSCTNCHDPHSTPSAEQRVDFYRHKCLACHATENGAGSFAAEHHPENRDCTSCHMPRSTAENIAHVAWTDHRILARPSAKHASAPQYNTLLPVFSPTANPRDHALALYASMNDGHTENGPQAYAQLEATFAHDRDDVQVLSALATISNLKGDTAQATALFAAVLSIEPLNRVAAVNLAILKARGGDLDQARKLLDPVFDRNQDIPTIATDLAAIACKQRDANGARDALQKALRYNPGSGDMRLRLAQVSSCSAPSPHD
jgi:predicted CXXCH cytochrome family protein